MDWYEDLLSGSLTLQDLSDDQLKQLRELWLDKDGNTCPTEEYFTKAKPELDRRRIEAARKMVAVARAKKKINTNFFKE